MSQFFGKTYGPLGNPGWDDKGRLNATIQVVRRKPRTLRAERNPKPPNHNAYKQEAGHSTIPQKHLHRTSQLPPTQLGVQSRTKIATFQHYAQTQPTGQYSSSADNRYIISITHTPSPADLQSAKPLARTARATSDSL